MKEVKPEINEQVIDILENLLKEAKKGRIQDIAVAGAFSDACTFNCFTNRFHSMAVLGELACLQRDYMDLSVNLRRLPIWEVVE